MIPPRVARRFISQETLTGLSSPGVLLGTGHGPGLDVDGGITRLVQSDNRAMVDASGSSGIQIGRMYVHRVGPREGGSEPESPPVERVSGKSTAFFPEVPWKRAKRAR